MRPQTPRHPTLARSAQILKLVLINRPHAAEVDGLESELKSGGVVPQAEIAGLDVYEKRVGG